MKPIHDQLDNIIPEFFYKPHEIKHNFYGVSQHEVRDVWKLIQPELEKTLEYSPENGICSGDVYQSLMNNKDTVLYIVEDTTGEYLGFFIVQFMQEYNSRICHIWLTGFKKPGAFMEVGKMVFNIARNSKCDKIRCSSTREAMGRIMKSFGMERSLITYEMDI